MIWTKNVRKKDDISLKKGQFCLRYAKKVKFAKFIDFHEKRVIWHDVDKKGKKIDEFSLKKGRL